MSKKNATSEEKIDARIDAEKVMKIDENSMRKSEAVFFYFSKSVFIEKRISRKR